MHALRIVASVAAIAVLCGTLPVAAMPHDVAEARGCKPRLEGTANFQCPEKSKGPCSAQDGGRRRAVAAWQEQVRAQHGAAFANWGNAYFPTFTIEGGAGSWNYTVSAYPCPRP